MASEKKIIIKLEKERTDYNPTEIYRVKEKSETIFSKDEKGTYWTGLF